MDIITLPDIFICSRAFYYYKGEKQYLQLDTNYVFISTVNESALQKNNLVSKGILTLNKEQTSHLLKQKQNMSADFYWAELELSGNNLDGSYIERINRIKQIDGVQVVSPYFTGKSEKENRIVKFFLC